MSQIVVYLLLCLSLHACTPTARHLGAVDTETIKGLQLPDKNVEPLVFERLRVQEEHPKVGFGRRTIPPSWDGDTMQQNNSEALRKETQGGNILRETADAEDRKRKVRSLMASPPNTGEQTVNSNENNMGEDIVVMDYAQPHRKAPIHNS